MKMIVKRFIRRLLWLFLYQWNSLTLFKWPYESCKRCGKSFRIVWSVKDEFWYKVMQRKDNGGGSLCLDCFIELAENKDIELKEDDFNFIYPLLKGRRDES